MANISNFKSTHARLKAIIAFSFYCAFFLLWPAMGFSYQQPNQIILKNEKLPFTPTEFHFAEVVDERRDKSKVGSLLLPETSGLQPVDLKGGGSSAISTFIYNSVPQNKLYRPVQVKILETAITENRGSTGIVEGNIQLHLSFFFLGEEDPVHLVDYRGGVSYKRSARQSELVEPALRRSLGAALKYFHDWIEIEAVDNVKLARGINLTFINKHNNPDTDTVFYSTERPLVFEDFRARPKPGSRFAASIFTSFSFDVASEIRAGILEVEISTKAYMLKDQSWVRGESKNEWTLNHEQRHFDITMIVMERLRNTLLNLEIYPDEYDSVINYYYLEAFREMNRLQDRYDRETRHGMDRGAQERWNKKLDQALQTGELVLN